MTFAQTPLEVLYDSDLSPGAKTTYAVLDSFARSQAECWPSHASIAEKVGCSQRSVRSYLKELQKAEFVVIARRRDKQGQPMSSVYTLTLRLASGKKRPVDQRQKTANQAANIAREVDPSIEDRRRRQKKRAAQSAPIGALAGVLIHNCGCVPGDIADMTEAAPYWRQMKWSDSQRKEWRANVPTYPTALSANHGQDILVPIWYHEGNLLLVGPVGTGKSHLAVAKASLDFRLKDGYSRDHTRFISASTLVTSLQPHGGAKMEDYLQPNILIIDDLGTERQTDFAAEKLFEVFNGRHNAGKRTYVTSNLEPERLAAHLGPRIWDRFQSGLLAIRLGGQSRRRQGLTEEELDLERTTCCLPLGDEAGGSLIDRFNADKVCARLKGHSGACYGKSTEELVGECAA